MTSVLFVCMGNICRSPSAQGVFEKLIESEGLLGNFNIDSAGTHSYHIGEPPDSRSMSAAKERNIDISHQRARRVSSTDFERFDYIVAMDDDNYHNLMILAPTEFQSKIFKMMDFAPNSKYKAVPDPYYGGSQGFQIVLDLLGNAGNGLLQHILNQSE